MAKKRNLKGYKRQGKRFVPPMMQLAGVQWQSYVNNMLPELIWLGLIHERKGYVFGRRTLEVVIDVVKDRSDGSSEMPLNFALQYAYDTLDEEEKHAILDQWETKGLLPDIQFAIAPLVLLYDNFALRFVGPPPTAVPENVLIQQMRDCVSHHLDKRQVQGVALHGAMMLTRLIAGKIRFSKEVDLPDFNAAFDSPDSAEGKHAASFMRSMAMGEMGMLDVPDSWARHFWNKNAELSPCEYPEYVEKSDA